MVAEGSIVHVINNADGTPRDYTPVLGGHVPLPTEWQQNFGTLAMATRYATREGLEVWPKCAELGGPAYKFTMTENDKTGEVGYSKKRKGR